MNQPIFAGNQFKYARQSADLLVAVSRLNAETDKDVLAYNIINAYINYYKLRQNQKIVAQNLEDIGNKLEEIQSSKARDWQQRMMYCRFELQQSDMKLNAMELENNPADSELQPGYYAGTAGDYSNRRAGCKL